MIAMMLADTASTGVPDPLVMVERLAQYGLLGLVLAFLGLMVWKYAPRIVAAFESMSDGVVSMSTSIEGLSKTQQKFVDASNADREENREQRGMFRSQITDVHRDVKDTLERVKRVEINTNK